MSLKIMVVDEDAKVLRLMKAAVVPLGHQILTFDDSREAADRVEQQRFDVVFVGMGMGHPDGFELTRRIRGSQPNRETAIVMLTATSDVETLRRAYSEGVTLYLTKPVAAARVSSMLSAMERPGWREKRRSVRLPLWTPVTCKWGDKEFALRSVLISESGMLLQPSIEPDIGQEVSLEFEIAEVRASLSVRAKIVHKEGTDRVAVQFVALAPEDKNAVHLYIMGRLTEPTSPRPAPLKAKPSRLWRTDR